MPGVSNGFCKLKELTPLAFSIAGMSPTVCFVARETGHFPLVVISSGGIRGHVCLLFAHMN